MPEDTYHPTAEEVYSACVDVLVHALPALEQLKECDDGPYTRLVKRLPDDDPVDATTILTPAGRRLRDATVAGVTEATCILDVLWSDAVDLPTDVQEAAFQVQHFGALTVAGLKGVDDVPPSPLSLACVALRLSDIGTELQERLNGIAPAQGEEER